MKERKARVTKVRLGIKSSLNNLERIKKEMETFSAREKFRNIITRHMIRSGLIEDKALLGVKVNPDDYSDEEVSRLVSVLAESGRRVSYCTQILEGVFQPKAKEPFEFVFHYGNSKNGDIGGRSILFSRCEEVSWEKGTVVKDTKSLLTLLEPLSSRLHRPWIEEELSVLEEVELTKWFKR